VVLATTTLAPFLIKLVFGRDWTRDPEALDDA